MTSLSTCTKVFRTVQHGLSDEAREVLSSSSSPCRHRGGVNGILEREEVVLN